MDTYGTTQSATALRAAKESELEQKIERAFRMAEGARMLAAKIEDTDARLRGHRPHAVEKAAPEAPMPSGSLHRLEIALNALEAQITNGHTAINELGELV